MADNGIPPGGCDISDAVSKAQVRMFNLAARSEHGFTIKVLHLETKIPTGTLRDWADGTSKMPLDGFVKISRIKGFPNELLSLPFECADKSVSDAAETETDFYDMALQCAEYLVEHVRSQHPNSPGAERIVHNETPKLRLAAVGVADRAGKVARK